MNWHYTTGKDLRTSKRPVKVREVDYRSHGQSLTKSPINIREKSHNVSSCSISLFGGKVHVRTPLKRLLLPVVKKEVETVVNWSDCDAIPNNSLDFLESQEKCRGPNPPFSFIFRSFTEVVFYGILTPLREDSFLVASLWQLVKNKSTYHWQVVVAQIPDSEWSNVFC